ncbi:hypothetical protein KUV46_15865 [Thalassovita mediterranea]|nr:hypothetical protein KUV46_15865 [Thalassovita mediterranea]
MPRITFAPDPNLHDGAPFSISAYDCPEGVGYTNHKAGMIVCKTQMPRELSVMRWGKRGIEVLHEETFPLEASLRDAEARLAELIELHRPELFEQAEAA